MAHCLTTICKTTQDYKLIASTIDVIFYETKNEETDYVKIVSQDKEDTNFYKKNYNEILNLTNSASERMALIADYLQNKENTPLQGLLFV